MPDDLLLSPAFSAENDRFTQLAQQSPVAQVDPHQDLVPHVWLSSAPDAGAKLGFIPDGKGFVLRLETVGQSPWVSLSCSVDLKALWSGHYIGGLVRVTSEAFLAYRPALRLLWKDGGFQDYFCEKYMASPGGEQMQLFHIPIPSRELPRSNGAELHLFFQGDSFEARFDQIEILLMR